MLEQKKEKLMSKVNESEKNLNTINQDLEESQNKNKELAKKLHELKINHSVSKIKLPEYLLERQ